MVQCRTLSDIKMAFIAGNSGTIYITIPAGSAYTFNLGWTGSRSLYFQSASAGVVVEILEYA